MPAPSFSASAAPATSPATAGFAIFGLIFVLGLTGCSSSFCGAPCEESLAKAEAAKAAKAEKSAQAEKAKAERAAAIKDTLPVRVNQYGSFYGYLEVDSLTATQLRVEKTSLEVMLAADAKDNEILKVLKEGKLDTTTFDYNDYSTGGSRYSASGKLRRDATVKDDQRRVPRMISESQHREVIERYRLLRRRMSRMRAAEAAAAEARAAVADSLTAANAPSLTTLRASPADSSLPPGSRASSPAPQPDSLWTGRCRANGAALAVPETFKTREACESWGQEQSGAFREQAYAFECECRSDIETVKRKFW